MIMALLFITLFAGFWIWRTVSSAQIIIGAFEMDRFYRDRLHIVIDNNSNYQWNDIVEKFVHLHQQRIYRVAVKGNMTELDVVARILRRENYMIAFINKALYCTSIAFYFALS